MSGRETRSTTRRGALTAAAVVLVIAFTGASAAGALAAVPTGSQPTTASLNQRLTKRQWASYQVSHKSFATTTQKTLARFRRCRASTAYARDAKALTACLGTSLAAELRVTRTLMATLAGFQGKVGGDCAKSLTPYVGALHLWRSVVTAVQRAARLGNVATMQSGIDNAITSYGGLVQAEKRFSSACKPA